MKVTPVKWKVKNSGVRPSFCSRPSNTPYHLCDLYEKELNNCTEAGEIVPFGTEPSQWTTKAYLVPKSYGSEVKIVTDFKTLNNEIER